MEADSNPALENGLPSGKPGEPDLALPASEVPTLGASPPADGQAMAAPPAAAGQRAALVIGPIILQSWLTPVVGLLMLVIGGLAGYVFGKGSFPLPIALAPTASPTAGPRATDDRSAALMELVVSRTRHFKGDPNAAVTLVEFSDYQ